MTVSKFDPKGTPEAQLRFFVGNLDPRIQRLFRSVRSVMRKRLPAANELVHDYFTFLVVAYSATDRPIDAIAAIAARPDGVRLYLMNGPKLPDPKKLLSGSGKQARFMPIEAARRLAHPDVKALIAAAVDLAGVRLPSKGGGNLIIRSISPKRKARRSRPK